MASASVDLPLPRAPMMQVKPWGTLILSPGKNPPLISIFSTTHISLAAAGEEGGTGSITYCTPEAETARSKQTRHKIILICVHSCSFVVKVFLEPILQPDLDHPHGADVGQVVVAHAHTILVVQRRSRQVRIACSQRLGRIQNREP